ncbi:hypothetical protein Taro_014509 [Colocasia esculenta]|uniref:Uncharacterized protein n=1 Tax=Colocasia esculenta TaxID=4460 RepID=A0A843U978_COLES|nr:hypothetical protein [Colocasia esculenta]
MCSTESMFSTESMLFRHCRPRIWAQDAHWFTVCERDGGECRILNAMVQGVMFTLPLLGLFGYMSAVWRARDSRLASAARGRRTMPSHSCRDSQALGFFQALLIPLQLATGSPPQHCPGSPPQQAFTALAKPAAPHCAQHQICTPPARAAQHHRMHHRHLHSTAPRTQQLHIAQPPSASGPAGL